MCSKVCRVTRSCGLTPARRSGRVPLSSSSYSGKSSPRPHSSSGSEERRSWPLPWQSSVSVERCGGSLLPGPRRRSSVHTASMHGGAAPFAASRPPCQRDQHQTCRSLTEAIVRENVTLEKDNSLRKTAWVVVVVVLLLWLWLWFRGCQTPRDKSRRRHPAPHCGPAAQPCTCVQGSKKKKNKESHLRIRRPPSC